MLVAAVRGFELWEMSAREGKSLKSRNYSLLALMPPLSANLVPSYYLTRKVSPRN